MHRAGTVRRMVRRWFPGGVVVVVGLAVAAFLGARQPGVAAAALVVAAGLAVAVSPAGFPRSIGAAEAQARSAADGRAIVYWRPGCPFCLRLRASLGRRARRAYWVDIWADPAGAAAVRAVTGGDETVPTVVVGGAGHVNPSPQRARELI